MKRAYGARRRGEGPQQRAGVAVRIFVPDQAQTPSKREEGLMSVGSTGQRQQRGGKDHNEWISSRQRVSEKGRGEEKGTQELESGWRPLGKREKLTSHWRDGQSSCMSWVPFHGSSERRRCPGSDLDLAKRISRDAGRGYRRRPTNHSDERDAAAHNPPRLPRLPKMSRPTARAQASRSTDKDWWP